MDAIVPEVFPRHCRYIVWEADARHVDKVKIFVAQAKVTVVKKPQVKITVRNVPLTEKWIVRNDGGVLVVAAPDLDPEAGLAFPHMQVNIYVPSRLKHAVESRFGAERLFA